MNALSIPFQAGSGREQTIPLQRYLPPVPADMAGSWAQTAFPPGAWLLDPLSHAIGSAILELEALRPLFTAMYNMPLLPLTRFYNSIVMGAGVLSILLAPLVFLGSRRLIVLYRERVVARFKSSPLWKLWSGTVFFKWYVTYEKFHG